MQTRAYAKINLTLDVLDPLPDGYHAISSVMQTIDLFDELEIAFGGRRGLIELTVDGEYAEGVPSDQTNLVWRVAAEMLRVTAADTGFSIRLTKHIPAQAGLGGGSSDAAAALLILNELAGRPFEREELIPVAASFGADVPFFLYGGTCLVEGIGERLTLLPPAQIHDFIIVKPPVGVSTAAAYAALDRHRAENQKRKPLQASWDGSALYNDFDEVVFEMRPEIESVRDLLLELGCREAHLCGSGSAVYGLCDGIDPSAVREALAMRDIGLVYSTRSIESAQSLSGMQ